MRTWPVLLLIPALLAPGCRKETEEDRIRKVFTQIEKAAAEGDVNGVLIHISDENPDKDQVKGLLLREMLQGSKIAVTRRKTEVSVSGESASVTFNALLRRNRKGFANPQDIGAWRFDLQMKKDGKKWRIVGQKYNRISGEEFLKP